MPPINNIRTTLAVARKKVNPNPHTVAAYNVARSAINALPGAQVRFFAQAINSLGSPLAAAERALTATIAAGSGGALSAASITTDANGIAEVVLTVGSVVGTVYRVRVTDTAHLTGVSPNVTIVEPPEDTTPKTVTLSPTTLALEPGGTAPIVATVRNAAQGVVAGVVAFQSSNTAVATVHATTGVVTAVAAGTCTITATLGSITSNGVAVTVAVSPPPPPPPPPPTVTLSPTTLALVAGDTATVTATVAGTSGTVAFRSSNTAVATVHPTTGVVTAVAAGNCTISATLGTITSNGVACTVTAAVDNTPRTVTLTPATLSLTPGVIAPVVATVRNALGGIVPGTVAFRSSNTAVATVHPTTGVVTGVGAGACTITATLDSIVSNGVAVTVAVISPPITVTLAPPTQALIAGATATLTATVSPPSTTGTVAFQSSNPAIATVNATTGVVTGVGAGTCAITAKLGSITSNSVPVTVTVDDAGVIVRVTFEDGTFAPFYNPWGDRIDVVTDPTGQLSGKVARLRYAMDGVNQVDDNRALLTPPAMISISWGQDIWFYGECVVPAGVNMTNPFQRKLVRFGYDGSQGFARRFEVVLAAFTTNFALVATPAGSLDGQAGNLYNIAPEFAQLALGVKQTVKYHIRPETALGAANAILQLWYNGVLIFDRSNLTFADPAAWTGTNLSQFVWNSWGFGDQVNFGGTPTDEYRYWDNIVYSRNPI